MSIQMQKPDLANLAEGGYALVIGGIHQGIYVSITKKSEVCICRSLGGEACEIPAQHLLATDSLPCQCCGNEFAIAHMLKCEQCSHLFCRGCLQKCQVDTFIFYLCEGCMQALDQDTFDAYHRYSRQLRGDAWAMIQTARRLDEILASDPIEQYPLKIKNLAAELDNRSLDMSLHPEQRAGLLNARAKLFLLIQDKV